MKNHMKIFWFMTFHKTLIGSKPLCIRFDKIGGFIRFYDGPRYLTLFCSEKYAIHDRILLSLLNLLSLKSSIIYFLTNFQKSKLILMILCQ